VKSDEAALIEYYGKLICEKLDALLTAETRGIRVRASKPAMRAVEQKEWKEGQELILRRLDAAEDGMTAREIQGFLMRAGYERMARNMDKTNLRRTSPMWALEKSQAVIMVRPNERRPRRWYSRLMYLRKFAQLPDAVQEAEVEKAIAGEEPVDND
jgi:hypothetical protein